MIKLFAKVVLSSFRCVWITKCVSIWDQFRFVVLFVSCFVFFKGHNKSQPNWSESDFSHDHFRNKMITSFPSAMYDERWVFTACKWEEIKTIRLFNVIHIRISIYSLIYPLITLHNPPTTYWQCFYFSSVGPVFVVMLITNMALLLSLWCHRWDNCCVFSFVEK